MPFSYGIMGGLSTFSSFVYGAVEIMKSPQFLLVGMSYLVLSIVIGFVAIYIGYSVGNRQYS